MFDALNAEQYAAVKDTSNPMLVLAGAGSGKTRVITYKIAWLMLKQMVSPSHIYAVTFTNKAAKEMKQRVSQLLESSRVKGMTICTFHRLGLTILKKEYEALGLEENFSIFDSSDCEAVIRDILQKTRDEDGVVSSVRQQISTWKNQLITPEQAQSLVATHPMQVAASKAYEEYQRYLRACHAVDLDDLLFLPNQLFTQHPDVCRRWQQKVRYLLVDEYQDTNSAQYQLVKTLVAPQDLSAINGSGLTVVGDDDQSIYSWRGAEPENLQRLKADFSDLQLIKLQQNYRSVGCVLLQANHIIQHNPRIFDKTLWSDLGFGEPIDIIAAADDEREAEKTVSRIMTHRHQQQTAYKDYAILYRSNHQARIIEQKLREMHIPYHLSGGLSFFDRSEIKDVMAYLRLLINPSDDNAFVRAINTPRRGIGAATIELLSAIAQKQQCGLYESIDSDSLRVQLSSKRQSALRYFYQWFEQLRADMDDSSPHDVLLELLTLTDFKQWLCQQSGSEEQANARYRNVEELLQWVKSMQKNDSEKTLADIISSMSLMEIIENNEKKEQKDEVSLMTLHAAKGLEFPYVSIVGVEEEVLPHRNSVEQDSIEEERRLMYVGITRAQKRLTLSYAKKRKRYGENIICQPSRFLEELDQEHVKWDDDTPINEEALDALGEAHLAEMRAFLS